LIVSAANFLCSGVWAARSQVNNSVIAITITVSAAHYVEERGDVLFFSLQANCQCAGLRVHEHQLENHNTVHLQLVASDLYGSQTYHRLTKRMTPKMTGLVGVTSWPTHAPAHTVPLREEVMGGFKEEMMKQTSKSMPSNKPAAL